MLDVEARVLQCQGLGRCFVKPLGGQSLGLRACWRSCDHDHVPYSA